MYNLPGTVGWGSTFHGVRTALWLPRMQAAEARLDAGTDSLGFTVTWASGRMVVVEASTNLASPVWFPLQTNTLAGDSFSFRDPDWKSQPARFYRARTP